MQVVIKSESSKLAKKTYMIRTSVTIGDQTTTKQEVYDTDWLLEHRMLTGTLDERVEFLRASAEQVTEKTVRQHFERMAKAAEPVVTEVTGSNAVVVLQDDVETPAEPVKKTRAKRQTKTTTESK